MNLYNSQFYACLQLVSNICADFDIFILRNIPAHFQLRKLSFDFYKTFFQDLLSFLKKMEPICVIHNISIATVYDIIILSDDVSIYSVDLFKEIVTLNTISVA